MNGLDQLNNSSFELPADDDGFTGRECPNSDCEGYFKIVFGTGLDGDDLPCHCPYCGHTDQHDQFFTQRQIKYIESVVTREFADALHNELKGLEFEVKPEGDFGIGLSVKVERGPSVPIHHYREEELETDLICKVCTLRYSVYGVFAYCPDCGQHNSLQILETNLAVIDKMVALARKVDSEISERLIENALEDCVSSFDGFGRELCRVNADKALDPKLVSRFSFQNLSNARDRVLEQFRFDLAGSVSQETWREAATLFQKRHLVTHKMGVVDQGYVSRSGDSGAVIGRKIVVTPDEVRSLADSIGDIARGFSRLF